MAIYTQLVLGVSRMNSKLFIFISTIFFLFGGLVTTHSQTESSCGFENTYPEINRMESVFKNAIEQAETFQLTFENTTPTAITNQTIIFSSNGDVLDQRLENTSLDTFINRATIEDNAFVFGQGATDSDPEKVVYLNKVDFQGNVLLREQYTLPVINQIFSIGVSTVVSTPENYLIVGRYVDADEALTPTFLLYVIKTDKDGNQVFLNTFEVGDFISPVIYDIDSQGNIYAGYQTSSRTGHIIKLTSNGTLAWDQAILGDLVSSRILKVELSNDEQQLIITGYADPKALIRRLDVEDGETISSILPGNAFTPDDFTVSEFNAQSLKTKDGGIVISYPFFSTGGQGTGIEYGKLDSNGNPVWSKRLFDKNYSNIQPILETSDGGFLFQTTNQDTQLVILKTTPTGDLVPLCRQSPVACQAEGGTAGIIMFNSQAEVDAFGSCEVFDGSIGIAGEDITNVDALAGLKEITGGLFIRNTATSLINTDGLKDIERIGDAFEFVGSSFGEPATIIPLTDLNLSSLISVGGKFQITGSNLERLNAPLLEHIGSENSFLQIIGNAQLSTISLASLLQVTGSVTLAGNNQLQLIEIDNLATITKFLTIQSNDQLEDINLNTNLEIRGEDTTLGSTISIANNPRLTTCCPLFEIIKERSMEEVEFRDNGPSCEDLTNLTALCSTPTNFIDLEIDLTTINPNPAIYTRLPLTVSLTNKGTTTAENIKISLTVCNSQSSGFQRASGIVYATTAFEATAGDYEYLNQVWTIPSLEANASASLEVTLFTLTEDPINIGASVFEASPDDIDSTPDFLQNVNACVVEEDDEDDLVLNGLVLCDCPDELDLVCGSDGITYANPCEAACLGVSYEQGACESLKGESTCGEITVSYGDGKIDIVGEQSSEYFFKVHRRQPQWEYVFECNGKCGFGQTISNLPTGTYYVDVYDKSWHLICDDIEVKLAGGQSEADGERVLPVFGFSNEIPHLDKEQLLVYPNPASNMVHINLVNASNSNNAIVITNNLGQVIKTIKIKNEIKTSFSLDNFNNGIYQISLFSEHQIIGQQRLVVVD